MTAFEIALGGWALGGLDWNMGLPMGWANVDEREARDAIAAGLDAGANVIDTADVYGHGRSERTIGAAIRGRNRGALILSTKTGYFRGCAPHPYDPLHMRHQLETSLANLGTDYLDVYFFHNLEFGASDEYLDAAIATMLRFRAEGKIRFVGLRGPHKHALARYRGEAAEDDRVRFLRIAEILDPDVLQVRFNLLTPDLGLDPFQWAASRSVPVFINKPLAQGLLLDKYDPNNPPAFPPGDHRERKAWFRPPALRVLRQRLQRLKERFGSSPEDLIRVALQFCLARSPHAVVLAGVRTPQQARMNVAAAANPLSDDDLAFVGETMRDIRDEVGEYFAHERAKYAEAELAQ